MEKSSMFVSIADNGECKGSIYWTNAPKLGALISTQEIKNSEFWCAPHGTSNEFDRAIKFVKEELTVPLETAVVELRGYVCTYPQYRGYFFEHIEEVNFYAKKC